MGKLDEGVRRVREQVGVGPPAPGTRRTDEQVDALLELTYDDDPSVRRVAAKNLCPCHVQADRDDVWERFFELARDPDAGVRFDVFHAMIDGSPRRLEHRVVQVLEIMQHDPDPKRRRQARQHLARYRRTGRLNPHAG